MLRPHVRPVIFGIATLGAGMMGLAFLLSLPDVLRSGIGSVRFSHFSVEEARAINGFVGRGLNQLLAATFLTIAVAVPLTANMYSVKFLDFFLKDPVNAGVLGLVVFAAFENAWAAYLIRDGFVPTFALQVAFGLLLLCWAAFLPYIYYVFRFLHPNTLLRRLEQQFEDALAAALRSPDELASERARVAEALEHIGNIAIRSVDRSDRSTALESVATVERLARTYWGVKERLPEAWFQAEPQLFLSFSSEAVEEFSANRSWVEMKLFSQLRLVLGVAVPRFHDLASRAAKALRRLGLEPQASEDPTLREAVTEFFNTFVRMTLVGRDARSAFTVFGQYRRYAEGLNATHPSLTMEIAFYFSYYGRIAREMGLTFVAEAVAHDIGRLVRCAWEAGTPNRKQLLDRFLDFDADAQPPLVGANKAHAILASYFLLRGLREPAALIRERLCSLPPDILGRLRRELPRVRREKYWEVNERRMNMEYVAPEQREILRWFLEDLAPGDSGMTWPVSSVRPAALGPASGPAAPGPATPGS